MIFQKKEAQFLSEDVGNTSYWNNLESSGSSNLKVYLVLLCMLPVLHFFLCKGEIESLEEKEVVFPRTTCLRPALCASGAQMRGRETPLLSNLLSCKT